MDYPRCYNGKDWSENLIEARLFLLKNSMITIGQNMFEAKSKVFLVCTRKKCHRALSMVFVLLQSMWHAALSRIRTVIWQNVSRYLNERIHS